MTADEREEIDIAEYTRQANQAWRDRWPNHCRECGGWGGTTFQQSHPYGAGSAYETLWEGCEALEPAICHRCGKDGLDRNPAKVRAGTAVGIMTTGL
jgi:hypothetical protein